MSCLCRGHPSAEYERVGRSYLCILKKGPFCVSFAALRFLSGAATHLYRIWSGCRNARTPSTKPRKSREKRNFYLSCPLYLYSEKSKSPRPFIRSLGPPRFDAGARRPVLWAFCCVCKIPRGSYANREKRKRYEVALDFALQKWRGAKIAKRTAGRLIAARGLKWRRPREKPILTPQDVATRLLFAKKYKGKAPKFWRNCVALDGKSFAAVLNATHRRWAGSQRLRGIYRKGGTAESLASFRVRKKGKERQMVGGRLGLIGASRGLLQKLFIYEIKKYVVGRKSS